MRKFNPPCMIFREEFVGCVGVVNAEMQYRYYGVVYRTKYAIVAQNIASLGRSINAKVLHTTTDEGLHVVSVKGFKQHAKTAAK